MIVSLLDKLLSLLLYQGIITWFSVTSLVGFVPCYYCIHSKWLIFIVLMWCHILCMVTSCCKLLSCINDHQGKYFVGNLFVIIFNSNSWIAVHKNHKTKIFNIITHTVQQFINNWMCMYKWCVYNLKFTDMILTYLIQYSTAIQCRQVTYPLAINKQTKHHWKSKCPSLLPDTHCVIPANGYT